MSRTMRGLLATLVMLLGALAMTGMLASSLQEKARSSQHVDEDFLPGGEAIDRHGWRIEPKAVRSDDTGQSQKARSRSTPDGSDDDGL